MGLDHSEAFVQIFFDGLVVFCFTGSKTCEAGMVQDREQKHEQLITIMRKNPNGTETHIVYERPLSLRDSVDIKVLNPVQDGVSKFTASGFNRVKNTGDSEDFRWIADLQNKNEFHDGKKLKLKRGGETELLRPKIFISHGIFYTVIKSRSKYRRKKKNSTSKKDLGKVADIVGADILEPTEGGRVRVIIGSDTYMLLRDIDEVRKGFSYYIVITNLCRRSDSDTVVCPPESDFPLFYNAMEDDDGIQFDLEEMHPPGDQRGKNPIEDTSEFKGFKTNGAPQVCNTIFLSQTDSIT